MAGKTNPDPPPWEAQWHAGGSVGCSCCIVLETSSDTANIFSYIATSLLHRVIQSLSCFCLCSSSYSTYKREKMTRRMSHCKHPVPSQILLQAGLFSRRIRFSVPSHTLVTKEVEKLIHTRTYTHTHNFQNWHFFVLSENMQQQGGADSPTSTHTNQNTHLTVCDSKCLVGIKQLVEYCLISLYSSQQHKYAPCHGASSSPTLDSPHRC